MTPREDEPTTCNLSTDNSQLLYSSDRNATIGSRCAAFHAGYTPKNIPVPVAITSPSATLHAVTVDGNPSASVTPSATISPIITPKNPPSSAIDADSTRN